MDIIGFFVIGLPVKATAREAVKAYTTRTHSAETVIMPELFSPHIFKKISIGIRFVLKLFLFRDNAAAAETLMAFQD